MRCQSIRVGWILGRHGWGRDAEFMKHIEDMGQVASLEQRWVNSWKTSLRTRCVYLWLLECVFPLTLFYRDLKPLRIPLHSKTSKRCPTCTHILIKPEQKAQSVRYKIKLVAANYLPAIRVAASHILKHRCYEAHSRKIYIYAGGRQRSSSTV
jgi:dynactin-4